jgi:hypothetical protein
MDSLLLRRTFWLAPPALALLALLAVASTEVAAYALAGFLAGAAACWLLMRPSSEQAARETEAFRAALETGKVASDQVNGLIEATSRLRHDLNGILSPTLLTADHLLAHEDPTVRRAGEIMVKTVERASARLAETRDQPPSRKPG